MISIIHPRWLIDENVRSFRIEVWLIPPILPVKIEIILARMINDFMGYKGIRDRGAIFCQVIRIREFFQFRPSMILVNQKCKGGAPSFIKIGIIIARYRFFSFWRFMIIRRRVLEASACTRKYLILVSVVW